MFASVSARRIVVSLCTTWVLATGALQISHLSTVDFGDISAATPTDRCRGSFSQRYDCTKSNSLAVDRTITGGGFLRLLLVLGPPLLGYGLWRRSNLKRQRRTDAEAARRRDAARVKRRQAAEQEWRRVAEESGLTPRFPETPA